MAIFLVEFKILTGLTGWWRSPGLNHCEVVTTAIMGARILLRGLLCLTVVGLNDFMVNGVAYIEVFHFS